VVTWGAPLVCGNCGVQLPVKGNRRVRVPGRRGGRLKLVCNPCADALLAQKTIEQEIAGNAA
jgi:hypothetical protein